MSIISKREIIVSGSIGLVQLGGKVGGFAQIDAQYASYAAEHNWYAHYAGAGLIYACTNVWTGQYYESGSRANRKRFTMLALHELCADLAYGAIPTGYWVDHISDDTLDNRTTNLRYVEPHANRSNQSAKTKQAQCGYFHVSVTRRHGKPKKWFYARIRTRGRTYRGKETDDVLKAAEEADKLFLRHLGPWASPKSLNFPEKLDEYLKALWPESYAELYPTP